MELHNLNLSLLQKRKLLRGLPIQLRNEHLRCGGAVVLDGAQSRKIRAAVRKGTGVRIQLHSPELLHHNVIHGAGFRDLLSKAKKALHHGAHSLHNHLQHSGVYDQIKHAAKNVAKNEGKKLLGHAQNAASKAISNLAQKLPENYQNDFTNGANNILDQQANAVNDQINGYGIGKTERKIINGFRQVGKVLKQGAHSQIGKQILKGVAKVAIPAALAAISAETGMPAIALAPALTNAANSGINGLGLKRKPGRPKKSVGRPRKGGALFSAGYGGSLI
jgi:hypothetical protein